MLYYDKIDVGVGSVIFVTIGILYKKDLSFHQISAIAIMAH